MVFHEPKGTITIGIGHEAGFTEVPEDKFMRSMPAGVILGMFMPDVGSLPCGFSPLSFGVAALG